MDPAPRRNSRRKEKVDAGCASIAVAARSKSSPEIVKVSSLMPNNVAKKTFMKLMITARLNTLTHVLNECFFILFYFNMQWR